MRTLYFYYAIKSHHRALTISEEGISIDRKKCVGCGLCADTCPSASLELMGRAWKVSELVSELIKDRAYFENSGGGITVSGGESTMQTGFVSDLLKELRSEGISTAIDTCGIFSAVVFKEILPYTDLVLYDIKESDSELHKKFTGASNTKIIENL